MRKLILNILFIIFPILSFSQIMINDISDFWTPNVIQENKIHKIVFTPSHNHSVIFTYRLDGQIESQHLIRPNGKDTSTVFHIYENNQLQEILHILPNEDTLSRQLFTYDNGRLIEEIDKTSLFNSLDITQYFYNNEGRLIEAKTESKSEYSQSKATKVFDNKGRVTREIKYDEDEVETIMNYSYLENKDIITNTNSKTIIYYNKNGDPIASNYYTIEENKETLETFIQFIYNKIGLLEFILVDYKSDAQIEYIKRE